MTRCSLCNQPSAEHPRISADAEAVMLAIQVRKVRGEPVTVPGLALACGLSLERVREVLEKLKRDGWLTDVAGGGMRVDRWVPTLLREWVVTHVAHGAEPPAGAEVSRKGLGHHGAHIEGIAYVALDNGGAS